MKPFSFPRAENTAGLGRVILCRAPLAASIGRGRHHRGKPRSTEVGANRPTLDTSTLKAWNMPHNRLLFLLFLLNQPQSTSPKIFPSTVSQIRKDLRTHDSPSTPPSSAGMQGLSPWTPHKWTESSCIRETHHLIGGWPRWPPCGGLGPIGPMGEY